MRQLVQLVYHVIKNMLILSMKRKDMKRNDFWFLEFFQIQESYPGVVDSDETFLIFFLLWRSFAIKTYCL